MKVRQKSHTSFVQKGWGLSVFLATILLIIPLIEAYTPADYLITTTNINNPTFQVKVNNTWQPISIKYGLIMEGGTLLYSDQAKGTKFYYSNSFTSRIHPTTQTPSTTIKFNVSTIIPNNAIGFFYEFNISDKAIYYPNMIVFPHKWHIYYDDLIKNYGQENIVVENNRILINNIQGNKLLNFDPEGGGDEIPLDCKMNIAASYNITLGYVPFDFKMGGRATWDGMCTGVSIEWQDNTSGGWNRIPNSATDMDCQGIACSEPAVISGTWYYKYPNCKIAGVYGVRAKVRFYNHLGIFYNNTATPITTISCFNGTTSITPSINLYYPKDNYMTCLNNELSFQVNISNPYYIHNISLWNTIGGNWHVNGTWYQHFLNSSNVLHLLYFNNSNLSENKLAPNLSWTNTSLNMEAGFLGDYGMNFTNNTGRISYDDGTSLNITYGTICMWLKPLENYAGLGKNIFTDYYDTNENIYFGWFGATTDWGVKKEHLNNNYVLYTTMNSVPKVNEWIHLCFSWDNSYTGIYINGTLKASSTGRNAPSTKWGHFEIGGVNAPIDYCHCVIDEFIIFDRKLTDGQIQNLYLTNNRTINFTNIGSVPAGNYVWNAEIYTYPNALQNYSLYNNTFQVKNCVNIPPPALLHDDKISFDISPYIIGLGSVVLVWLIILFLLLWYRRRGKANVRKL